MTRCQNSNNTFRVAERLCSSQRQMWLSHKLRHGINKVECELKEQTAARYSPCLFVLSAAAFVLLSRSGYERVMFPSRQLILTLYMEIRPGEKESRACR